MDFHLIVHLAEDVLDPQDQAALFTALKPTCRRLCQDIKVIQERLANSFMRAVRAVPVDTKRNLDECVAECDSEPYSWVDYCVDLEGHTHYNLMDVCEGAFGPDFSKAGVAFAHMDPIFRETLFPYLEIRANETFSAYRCFVAAQALVASAENDP